VRVSDTAVTLLFNTFRCRHCTNINNINKNAKITLIFGDARRQIFFKLRTFAAKTMTFN
jgi:hypothetical protein